MKSLTQIITSIIVVMGLTVMATSCTTGNAESTAKPERVKAKLQNAYLSTEPYIIRSIDPMFEPGDKVEINGTDYKIISIDRPTTECRFEGAECPNVQHYLRDYQIELFNDTVWVYDADRLVGKYTNTKWDSQLDSILLKDNL